MAAVLWLLLFAAKPPFAAAAFPAQKCGLDVANQSDAKRCVMYVSLLG
jgi:hypothetical protein